MQQNNYIIPYTTYIIMKLMITVLFNILIIIFLASEGILRETDTKSAT